MCFVLIKGVAGINEFLIFEHSSGDFERRQDRVWSGLSRRRVDVSMSEERRAKNCNHGPQNRRRRKGRNKGVRELHITYDNLKEEAQVSL